MRAAPGTGRRGASRLVWTISVPLLFVEVGDALIHVTDTGLLARVGTEALAAIAVADIAREIWVVPAIGLAEAAQIVIARRAGHGDEGAIGATFARSMLLVLAVGLVLAAALVLLAGPVSGLLVASPEVGRQVEAFLGVAALGLPLQALNMGYSSLFVGLGRTRVLVWATVVLVLANLVLSGALVFGALGLPRLGIEGAGYGYAGAELLTFAYLTAYTLRQPELRALGLLRLRAPNAPGTAALGRLAGPIALQGVVEVGRWLVFFVILERIGPEALAYSNLVYACFALLIIPTYAFGETAYSLVSRAIGEDEDARVGSVVRRTIGPALLVTLPFALAALVAPELVLAAFSDDPAAIEGAATTLRVVAVIVLVAVPAEMWLAALFGTGDSDAAFGIEVVNTIAMLACAYVAALVLELDLVYVWLSVAVGSLVGLPLAYGWIRSGRWRERVI